MKIIGLALIALVGSGCASNYKDFKEEQVRTEQGVAVGRIQVNYNGQAFSKNCQVCFKNASQRICQKLTEEGFVFVALSRGENTWDQLQCHDVSPQNYNIKGARFVIDEGVNYFGDIAANWKNKGGFKAATLFGAVGAALIEANSDGELQLAAHDANAQSVWLAYQKQVKTTKFKFKKHIMTIAR